MRLHTTTDIFHQDDRVALRVSSHFKSPVIAGWPASGGWRETDPSPILFAQYNHYKNMEPKHTHKKSSLFIKQPLVRALASTAAGGFAVGWMSAHGAGASIRPARAYAGFGRFRAGTLARALAVWAAASVLMIGAAVAYLNRFEASELERVYRQTDARAQAAENALLRALDGVRAIHDLLGVRQSLLDRNAPRGAIGIEEHLAALTRARGLGIVQASLVGRSGLILWGTGNNAVGVYVGDREHVRAHLDAGAPLPFFISSPVTGRTSGVLGIQCTAPVFDADGRFTAIASVSLDPIALSNALGDDRTEPHRVTVIRRIADGALVARSRDAARHLERPADPQHPAILAARGTGSGRLRYASTFDGRGVFASFRVPAGTGLVVTAIHDEDEAMAALRQLRLACIAALAIAITGGFLIALYWADRHRRRELLVEAATRDPLTGLLNRRSFEQQAKRALTEARGIGGTTAVLLIDVDRFKSINDQHGHAMGDQVLREVSLCMRENVRASSDLVCRWGGEEVIVMLQDCTASQAWEQAERLRQAVRAIYPKEGEALRQLTISIGLALVPGHGRTLDQAARAADAGLYEAKRQGRDRVMMVPVEARAPQRAPDIATGEVALSR